jgi:hypothetical protein
MAQVVGKNKNLGYYIALVQLKITTIFYVVFQFQVPTAILKTLEKIKFGFGCERVNFGIKYLGYFTDIFTE